jgi:hypothetical protein
VAGLLAVQAVLALGHLLASGARPWPGPATLPLLLGASALCYLGNLAQTHAIARAPNPGLALAIIGASTALVTVLANVRQPAQRRGLRIGQGLRLCAPWGSDGARRLNREIFETIYHATAEASSGLGGGVGERRRPVAARCARRGRP